MLIKSQKRIISDDGKYTYKSFGFVINMHNFLFSGQIIFKIKYSYQPIAHKIDAKIKHGVSFVSVRGFDTKYAELRLVSIKKVK